jgi:hypothetical protein
VGVATSVIVALQPVQHTFQLDDAFQHVIGVGD